MKEKIRSLIFSRSSQLLLKKSGKVTSAWWGQADQESVEEMLYRHSWCWGSDVHTLHVPVFFQFKPTSFGSPGLKVFWRLSTLGALLENIFQFNFTQQNLVPALQNQPLMQNETQAIEMIRRFASEVQFWSELKHWWRHIISITGRTAVMVILCPRFTLLHYALQPQCREKA